MTDILTCMDETLALARAKGLDALIDERIPMALRYSHLEDMRRRYVEFAKAGTPLHERKASRWLGWMQAAVMALSAIDAILGGGPALDLEHFKAINRRN